MPREFQRGHKAKISDLTAGRDLYVGVQIAGSDVSFDISCFGLDADELLSDDRYFVFYNQPKSPEGAIQQLGAQAGDTESFRVTLDSIPSHVQKLTFTATVDGEGQMSQIDSGYLRLVAGGDEVARYAFTGAEFSTERAVMLGDVYLKGEWRFAAVGQGFDGGLETLLKHFGGELLHDDPAPEPESEPTPAVDPTPAPDAAPSFAPPTHAGPPPGFAPPAGTPAGSASTPADSASTPADSAPAPIPPAPAQAPQIPPQPPAPPRPPAAVPAAAADVGPPPGVAPPPGPPAFAPGFTPPPGTAPPQAAPESTDPSVHAAPTVVDLVLPPELTEASSSSHSHLPNPPHAPGPAPAPGHHAPPVPLPPSQPGPPPPGGQPEYAQAGQFPVDDPSDLASQGTVAVPFPGQPDQPTPYAPQGVPAPSGPPPVPPPGAVAPGAFPPAPPGVPGTGQVPLVPGTGQVPLSGQVAPGAEAALAAFQEAPTGQRWTLQNSKLVRVDLAVSGKPAMARQGTVVLYQGEVEFGYEGSGVRVRSADGATDQEMQLTRCAGEGQVFLADEAAHLHPIGLQGDGVCVCAEQVLAFDEDLHYEVRRIEGQGIPGGALVIMQFQGSGTVVVKTHGAPVVLPVTPTTFADSNAIVAWSAGSEVVVSDQVQPSPGQSGESVNLQFRGAPGDFIVVQPYEV